MRGECKCVCMFSSLGAAAFLASCMILLLCGSAPAKAATRPYIHFDRFDTHRSLSAGRKDAVVVAGKGGSPEVRLGAHPHRGTDRSGRYNGGRYYRGTLTSPVYQAAQRQRAEDSALAGRHRHPAEPRTHLRWSLPVPPDALHREEGPLAGGAGALLYHL
jgi:hypothetical protein